MPRRRRHRGTGTVYRDRTLKRWIARWPLGHGKYRKVSAPNEPAALQALEQMRREFGTYSDPVAGSLDDYLLEWLRHLRVSQATQVSYTGHVQNHISPLLGAIPVARLTHRDVRRLITDRLDAGLSPSTVRRIHSTLHAALAQGVAERTLTHNAASKVPLPKVEERLVEAMTEEDADAIRAAVKDTYLEALIELLLGSGLRLGEALGLDHGDVRGNVVMVRRTKTRKRAVVISDDAAEALRRHISTAKVRGANQPVFLGPRTGDRLRGGTVSHAFPKMLMAAGLARLTPHGTRHGVASMLVAQGVHMKVIANQLGHASVSTTDRFYAHVSPASVDDAVRLLNRRAK